MKKLVKKKSLQRHILASMLALGMINVCGVAGAEGIYNGQIFDKDILGYSEINATIGEKTIENGNRKVAIGASKEDVNIQTETLNIDVQNQSGYDRLYGIDNVNTKNLTITANNININLSAKGNTQVRAIRNNSIKDANVGKIEINGNLVGNIAAENADYIVFFDSWGDITINGKTNVKLTTDKARFIGVQNYGTPQKGNQKVIKQNTIFNDNFSMEANLGQEYGSSGTKWAQGVLSYWSLTEFNGNTEFIINDASNYGTDTRIISQEGNPNDKVPAVVNFNGDNTSLIYNATGIGENHVDGILSSAPESTVNFNGENVSIDINGNNSKSVIGIQSQYGGHVNSQNNTALSISVNSKNRDHDSHVMGINVVAYSEGENAIQNSNINLLGTVNIQANSIYGSAFGIFEYSDVEDSDNGTVYIGDDLSVLVDSENGEAYGIYAYGGESNINANANVSIAASGKEQYSVVALSNADIVLGNKNKTVSLTGDVVAQGGEISLNGSNNSVVGDIAATGGGIVNITADNGVYNVQQMYAEERGVINVGKDTTLNVNSKYLTNDEYLVDISDGGAINVDDSAKLRILNAEKGQEFNIVKGSSEEKWLTKNISADNFMLQYEQKEDGSNYIITTVVADAAEVFDGAVIIPKALTQNLRLADKGDAAFDFFTAVTDSNNFTKEQAINAINSAADMHELGGVNHAAYSVHNAMTDAVADHLSLADYEHDGHEHDKDIWAHYIHNKENIRGMNLDGLNANYDLQYNGIVVGSDLYNKGKAVAGLALSYADGNVNSGTASSHTRNEADYYGISLYGRIKNGGSALLGDISYMHGSNDLTQHNSGHDITASVKTDAFSVGVKAEQEFKTGAGRVVPYAGLRYMHLGAGSYTNSLGLHYDADDQNLLLLPMGVAYSCELKKGSWSFRPVIDLGYVWTMGDREADMTVSLNGASDGFGFNTADSGSFVSRLALEAEKNNITYGLGYEYQKGDSVKANKWLANLTVPF